MEHRSTVVVLYLTHKETGMNVSVLMKQKKLEHVKSRVFNSTESKAFTASAAINCAIKQDKRAIYNLVSKHM